MAPPKRRAQRAAQSTLTFHKQGSNRITKPGVATLDTKTGKKDADTITITPTGESNAKIAQLPSTTEDDQTSPREDGHVKPADVLSGKVPKGDAAEATSERPASAPVSEDESRAKKVTDSQIKKYWQGKQDERKAPRVHQEDLSLQEKILREWDMSGQYGPCIGIARLKRWKRAQMLGLDPPVEVLAVLLKEADKGNIKAQRAHFDELMTSRFVET